MPDTAKAVRPGDWVRISQLWPGIWRVYRVLSGFNEPRWSLDNPKIASKRTLVFSHRLVNNSGKRSFSHQSCEVFFVEPLSESEVNTLLSETLSDALLMKAFNKYCSANTSIDSIANLSFGDLSEEQLEEFPTLCERLLGSRIDAGITLDDVLLLMKSTWLEAHKNRNPRMVTLQLTCPNHELRDGDEVYRQFRVW